MIQSDFVLNGFAFKTLRYWKYQNDKKAMLNFKINNISGIFYLNEAAPIMINLQ